MHIATEVMRWVDSCSVVRGYPDYIRSSCRSLDRRPLLLVVDRNSSVCTFHTPLESCRPGPEDFRQG
jgi:hypothetical protein